MKDRKPTLARTVFASIRNRRDRPQSAAAHIRSGHGLLVATYNVHKCVGTDGRFDPGRIMDVIREIDPDVIALQEADKRFGEKVGLLDMERLQADTGLTHAPVKGVTKSHGWRGNVLLFKQGIVRNLHQVALPGLEPRGALVADIDLEHGRPLRVIAAHLGLLLSSRRLQAETILGIMNSGEPRPTLLMGDFNEWRLGTKSALNGLAPVFGPLPPAVPSFPSRLPVLSLDRIMANQDGLITGIEVHDSPLSRISSDHLPLKARINLEPASAA